MKSLNPDGFRKIQGAAWFWDSSWPWWHQFQKPCFGPVPWLRPGKTIQIQDEACDEILLHHIWGLCWSWLMTTILYSIHYTCLAVYTLLEFSAQLVDEIRIHFCFPVTLTNSSVAQAKWCLRMLHPIEGDETEGVALRVLDANVGNYSIPGLQGIKWLSFTVCANSDSLSLKVTDLPQLVLTRFSCSFLSSWSMSWCLLQDFFTGSPSADLINLALRDVFWKTTHPYTLESSGQIQLHATSKTPRQHWVKPCFYPFGWCVSCFVFWISMDETILMLYALYIAYRYLWSTQIGPFWS